MARSKLKNYADYPLTVTTQYLPSFDISNHSGFAVTVKSKSGSTSGTVKLQYCNFDSTVDADWTDIPTLFCEASKALVANGGATIATLGLHPGFVRAAITLSAGAGNYDIYYLAKDF